MSEPLNFDGKPMPARISADYYGQNGSMGTYGLSGGACGYVREDLYNGRIARMSGEDVKAMITELSGYLTQSEIQSLAIGDGAIVWDEEVPA